jgi:hypothetical protein
MIGEMEPEKSYLVPEDWAVYLLVTIRTFNDIKPRRG